MRKIVVRLLFIVLPFLIALGCVRNNRIEKTGLLSNQVSQPVYLDTAFMQEYSVKYYLSKDQEGLKLTGISANRDDQIRILSDQGILVPDNGSMMYPGKLIPDVSYKPGTLRQIRAIGTYQNQTFYLDGKQLFSNAWAGKIQIDHGMPAARLFAAGADFDFLISDGNILSYFSKNGLKTWTGKLKGIKQIIFQKAKNCFLIVTPGSILQLFSDGQLVDYYRFDSISCAEPINDRVVVGTSQGYLFLPEKKLIQALPCPGITVVKEMNGVLWFGTIHGAFSLSQDGRYSYYAGERWLPGNQVIAIEPGPDGSILILTEKGLGQIFRKEMTLEEKAMFYEKQVREKNIRYGFNCSSVRLANGFSSAETAPQPSDNLWTAMYLASQLYRYNVTGSVEAKENALEAFEALERLHTVTGIKGLFGRSFERDRSPENTKETSWEKKEYFSGSPASYWLKTADLSGWAWRATASSDQAVGQFYAMTMMLELADDEALKRRALTCLDNLMEYIVDNDLYIIDPDGKPTLWGRWNPDYVNHFPENVGDRKLYSSNIISFLQTAYKYTGKTKYRDKAFELMDKYGYLENLMRPIKEIGHSDADDLSKLLSEEWNHSDDEMYFLAYKGLFEFALTPELKQKYLQAIKDHWNSERPEKNALWNFIYASTGDPEFDLEASVGFLKNYPLDLRNWAVQNSQRRDIEFIPDNFRKQTTKESLPLGELPLYRHNGNIFRLDNAGDGNTLISAGDTWLLPYWMGRYLGVISAPERDLPGFQKH